MHTRLADLTLLSLAPLLIAQGRKVRRDTPLLPEPPGERAGVRGRGRPLRLLILGDSAAAGVGAPSQDEALLGRLLERLAPHREVTYALVARTGMTSTDALDAVFVGDHVHQPWSVVVTSLGVNDATALRRSARFRREQRELLERIERAFRPAQVLLSGLPPLHHFPALPEPLRAVIGARATRLDAALHELADEAGRHVTHLSWRDGHAFEPAAMASDGFHPGPLAYELWAEMVVCALGDDF